LRGAARRQSHVHEQVVKIDGVLLLVIGQKRGWTRGNHTLQRLACVHQHGLSGQETRVNAADFRQAQKTILDASHHHPHGIHVRGDE
jgi:hypothetical protein